MYVHGLNQNDQQPGQPVQNLTWLDYLIISNPQGVMKVLAAHGYSGYLAPVDQDEMYEVCVDLMDKYGDQAVIELLKSHPLYDIIKEISMEETKIVVPFKNASGVVSGIETTIKTINFRLLAENILVLIGAFFLAGKVWDLLAKKE